MGKVEPVEITPVKTRVFLLDTHPVAGWAPALILAHLHACLFLTARINPLANKHPANTQSLHKPSLTFSPY